MLLNDTAFVTVGKQDGIEDPVFKAANTQSDLIM